MPRLLPVMAFFLAGCAAPLPPVQAPRHAAPEPTRAVARQAFATVVGRMEPVAERMCRERTEQVDCDFLILIDDTPGEPPNAYQTLARNGRPVLVVSESLLVVAQNSDEMALVLGHEAAHHIEGHLPATIASAQYGAVLLGTLAQAQGYGQETADLAAALGAELGARTFSKEFELEADALGAVIAHAAGYDPVRGAAFFSKIPDPGDEFLGTHPPNRERQARVAQVAGSLQ